MIRSTPTTRYDVRRGFTLLEVLMAAIIISLGVLGLTALFAGAARQQQIASEMTQSVIATKNAEALMAGNFGNLTSSSASVFEDCFEPDLWYPVPMDDRDHYLKIDAGCDTGGAALFFLMAPREETPVVLYDLPDNDTAAIASAIGRGNATDQNGDNRLDGRPFGTYSSNFNARRIDPFSIPEIRVYTRPNPASPTIGGNEVLRYRIPASVDPDIDASITDWIEGDVNTWQFTINGEKDKRRGSPQGGDYIEIDLRELGGNSGPLAGIEDLLIESVQGADRYIDRIEVVDYRWRNDQLVSLNDRLIYVRDETAPDGRRASIGYTVLYRRTAQGDDQMALITYALTPSSGGTEYIPPERPEDIDAAESPLVRVRARLFWDDAQLQHYIRVSDRYAWVAAPGQVVFMESRMDINGDDRLYGADFGVRVTRRQRDGNNWRGYLDRVPRAANFPMLEDRNGSSTGFVWVVQERVESVAQDRSEWNLRPLEVRVFQLP